MDTSFRLEASEHDRIFLEEIEAQLLAPISPVAAPKAVFIAGQTGAGKSNLLKRTFAELDKNAVFVNTDALRRFYPKFKDLGSMDDTTAAQITHHDASEWRNQLLDKAVETRRNVVMEGVFKDGPWLVSKIKVLKKSGYEVTVKFMSVHERFSVCGVYMRYETEKAELGHGRFATRGYHDECYEKLLDTAVLVEQDGSSDKIEVYNRAAEILFETKPPGSSNSTAVKNAIEEGRARALTSTQRGLYESDWDWVIAEMEKRKAPHKDIAAVHKIAQEFLKDL